MGRLVPNDIMVVCRAAPVPGSIHIAIVLLYFSSPPFFFPAKRKLKEEVSLVELPSATNSLLQSVQTR